MRRTKTISFLEGAWEGVKIPLYLNFYISTYIRKETDGEFSREIQEVRNNLADHPDHTRASRIGTKSGLAFGGLMCIAYALGSMHQLLQNDFKPLILVLATNICSFGYEVYREFRS